MKKNGLGVKLFLIDVGLMFLFSLVRGFTVWGSSLPEEVVSGIFYILAPLSIFYLFKPLHDPYTLSILTILSPFVWGIIGYLIVKIKSRKQTNLVS